MAPEIIVYRKNCEEGKWEITTDSQKDPIKVDGVAMAERYIKRNEAVHPEVELNVRKLSWVFEPEKPEDIGKDGIPGKLTIRYTLK
jgi:hypothetical protein